MTQIEELRDGVEISSFTDCDISGTSFIDGSIKTACVSSSTEFQANWIEATYIYDTIR